MSEYNNVFSGDYVSQKTDSTAALVGTPDDTKSCEAEINSVFQSKEATKSGASSENILKDSGTTASREETPKREIFDVDSAKYDIGKPQRVKIKARIIND